MIDINPSSRFCMTTWLPRCRTLRKPCRARMPQTSRPDKTRSLPNLDLKARHKHFRMAPSLDLCGISRLKEEFGSLL